MLSISKKLHSLIFILSFLFIACGSDSGDEDNGLTTSAPVYVENAGIILAWPFLPNLFERTGYLENGQFKDHAQQETAVKLLQFLTTGQTGGNDSLAINKILCGLDPNISITIARELNNNERETANNLLHALITNWPAVRNTSIAGLRETFLTRRGVLSDQGDYWELTLEPKAVDVLLNQLPWNISLIRLPWMPKPLKINWN